MVTNIRQNFENIVPESNCMKNAIWFKGTRVVITNTEIFGTVTEWPVKRNESLVTLTLDDNSISTVSVNDITRIY